MNTEILIFHDIETIKANKKGIPSHVVQIGAVKVLREGTSFKVVSEFNTLVNPGRSIGKETESFTGITEEQVRKAHSFIDVRNEFIEWIGEETYYLLSWSLSDKLILIDECNRLGIDKSWLRNYNDVQEMFMSKFGLNYQPSLTKAAERLGVVDTKFHDGLSDALCTFRIYEKIFDQNASNFDLQTNEVGEVYSTSVVYKDEDFNTNPFVAMKDLLYGGVQ